MCHPQNTLLCVLIILSCRHLKSSKCRKRPCLVSPYLPGGRSSKTNSVATSPLLGSFIRQGVLALIQERRPEVHTTPRRPLWQTIKTLSCSSKGLVLLPQFSYFPLRGLHSSSPFFSKRVFHLEF